MKELLEWRNFMCSVSMACAIRVGERWFWSITKYSGSVQIKPGRTRVWLYKHEIESWNQVWNLIKSRVLEDWFSREKNFVRTESKTCKSSFSRKFKENSFADRIFKGTKRFCFILQTCLFYFDWVKTLQKNSNPGYRLMWRRVLLKYFQSRDQV